MASLRGRIMKHVVLSVIFAVAVIIAASSVVAQTRRPADMPEWEAVSIKPCAQAAGERSGRGGGGGPRTPTFSPGRLNISCTTVARLIAQAYISLPDGRRNLQISMEGGPSWINSDQYEINAKADGTPSRETMTGEMLQAILEGRFKLKVHRETREVPVYAMTVAKGGMKVQPLEDGSCDPRDPTKPRPARGTPDGIAEVLQPGQKPTCALVAVMAKGGGDPGTIVSAQAASLTEFAGVVRAVLDRPIINKTGIPGIFNFRVQFANFQNTAGPTPADPAGPSIFTAVQEQLGLRLEATKGPGEIFVIDNIEHPTEN